MVVAPPTNDCLLDGFGVKLLTEAFFDEGWEFGVGGEAQGDEAAQAEVVDAGLFCRRQQGGESEPLFEADDPVLQLEIIDAALEGEDEECEGDDDPPEMQVAVFGPMVDGEVD